MMQTRREALILGASLILPSVAYGAARDITTYVKKWDNGSHAFIARARNEKYGAEIVSAREITGNDLALTQEIQERTGAYATFSVGRDGFYMRKGNVEDLFVRDKGDGILYIDKEEQVKIIGSSGISPFMNIMADAVQVKLISAGRARFYIPNQRDMRFPRTFVGLTNNELVAAVLKNVNITLGDEIMRNDYDCKIVVDLCYGDSPSACDKFGRKSFRRGDRLEERVSRFLVIYD